MKKAGLFVAVVALVLSFGTVAYAATNVTIFHTNDVHGRFVHYDAPGFNANAIGIDTVAAILAAHENAVLVDAGDTFHGVPFVNLGGGFNAVELMNVSGYSLFTPGNHDFNFGIERLLELEEAADFGFIAANIFHADGSLVFRAHKIIEIAGVSFGFFGITTPDTPFVTHPDNVAGIEFGDPVVAAQSAATALRVAGADVIIALTHLGLDGYHTSVALAQAVPEIDIIIDGHSHDLLPTGLLEEGVLIVQAGEHGAYLGRVDVVFSVDVGGIVSLEASVIDREYAHANFQPKPEVAALIETMKSALDETLSEVVGFTPVDLVGEREYIRTMEMPLGNLVAESMAWGSGAQLALANSGGIRDSILAGDVTIGDVITVLTFPNYIVVKEISPASLWEALENSVSLWPADVGRFPQVYGLSFTFDGYAEPGERVLNITVGGTPIVRTDTDTTFTLAVNDFVAAGGDGFAGLVGLPRVSEAGLMSDIFTEFLSIADLTVGTEGRIVQAGVFEEEAPTTQPATITQDAEHVPAPVRPLDMVERRYVDGVAFVPIRALAYSYRALDIEWDAETQTVTITTSSGDVFSFVVGYRFSFLDDEVWRVFITYEHASDIFY